MKDYNKRYFELKDELLTDIKELLKVDKVFINDIDEDFENNEVFYLFGCRYNSAYIKEVKDGYLTAISEDDWEKEFNLELANLDGISELIKLYELLNK